ncbi:DUF2635 domain-containing protein [Rhizobium ruizarguesonis]|uniref:DUF2635 domain-containing protein n=1 Tax=Rhizobium ruizarguesonis TaxID=2081791 RepID=UPI00103198F6|nr:DUF2635 domain-containing protein [Rhizobium ruizarguesonis]TAY75340.1 DUF2635 domain-containing protein [Rhizobium ruizarguesonis]
MLGFYKPAEGMTVDQENGTPWPADGMDAPNTLFNRRRINCGDLVEAERPVEASADAELEEEQPIVPEGEPPEGEQIPDATLTETPSPSRRSRGVK